ARGKASATANLDGPCARRTSAAASGRRNGRQARTKERQKIIAERQARVRRARAEHLKRLEAEALRAMQGRQGQDYVSNEDAELQLAEKIIAAYLDDGEEASFIELKEILMQFAVDPRHVMTIAKKLLMS